MQTRTRSETGSDRRPDHDVISNLKKGDGPSTDSFVRENIAWMLASAHRIVGDRYLAEDCVQAAFMNVFGKLDDFKGQSSLRTWMHRIVVNQALMSLRSRKRLQERSLDDLLPAFEAGGCRLEDPWTTLETPESLLVQSRTAEYVLSAIQRMPDIYRIVLLLRDIEEMSTSEVAVMLELSESNVKVRLHRARSGLKKLLEPLLRGQEL
ncbi:MAG: sigma-70 family RNA polymerase sigma factor [Proteobacteria bacterium]|nr:sigma-70 family RNA polymerase sigma factor [Pseudomonadota bacterium]